MLLFFCLVAFPVGAAADPSTIVYAPAGTWVLPPPSTAPDATPEGALLKFAFVDGQVRVTPAGAESFSSYRVTILRPEALAVGNITLTWNPAAGEARVHELRIIRAGVPIDVLATTRFRVIQREENLEQSMLSGVLTATLQVPGLMVGDELEFSATVQTRDPTIGDRAFNMIQLPVQATPGAFRLRLLWPENSKLQWRISPDLPITTPKRAAGENQLVVLLKNPSSALLTEGAPPRYNVRRLVEYSEFASWNELSDRFASMFADAARPSADSPLHAEAVRIAATHADPRDRLVAALRLVQDRVRYVYIGFGDGNFRPASVDETWKRRFGDCKAKSALLLALLGELGIEAEAALVNTGGGDGTDARLPSPAAFNHVVVRATIGGKRYWLDGTRTGDVALANLPPPAFRWALPLRRPGAKLEPVAPQPPSLPDIVRVTDIDATGGFEKPAKLRMTHIYRGDQANVLGTQLAALSKADADRQLSAYWRNYSGGLTVSTASWRRDSARGVVALSVEGEETQDWSGDTGHLLNITGAGFSPPAEMRRPAEQDQSAPWLTEFPMFRCWATTVRLPAPSAGMRWAYRSFPVNRQLAGFAWWRSAGLSAQIIRTVMSKRSEVPEITAAQAAAANAMIPGFDNAISQVYEIADGRSAVRGQSKTMPFDDDTDWAADDVPCAAPESPALARASQPIGLPDNVVFDSDYPISSRAKGEQGVVRLALKVSAAGRVTDCSVITKSDYPTLDKTSCEIVTSRFSYKPARDSQGVAVEGTAQQPILWRLGQGQPRPLLYGIKLRGERPLDETSRICLFSDDFSFILPKTEPCVLQLPRNRSGQTLIDAQQAAVAKGENSAKFGLAMQLQQYQYEQSQLLLRDAAAKGYAPAAAMLCNILASKAPTPVLVDEALQLCQQAVDQGFSPAYEPTARLLYAARQRLGIDHTATRLKPLAVRAGAANYLLAQVWHEAGKNEQALPVAYVAAWDGFAQAWETLHAIFSETGGAFYNPRAAYVWGRIAGVPVDAMAAALPEVERLAASAEAAACIKDLRLCKAGVSPAMQAELEAQQQHNAYKPPERLDRVAAETLGIPDSAGIALLYHINDAGSVDDCSVGISSLDYTRDRAACDWFMANARYRPATIGGIPKAVWGSARASVSD